MVRCKPSRNIDRNIGLWPPRDESTGSLSKQSGSTTSQESWLGISVRWPILPISKPPPKKFRSKPLCSILRLMRLSSGIWIVRFNFGTMARQLSMAGWQLRRSIGLPPNFFIQIPHQKQRSQLPLAVSWIADRGKVSYIKLPKLVQK